MTVYYPLYVLLILINLTTCTLAAFRDTNDDFGQLYIRSPSGSSVSLEEGEIGHSSDEVADEFEEGEYGLMETYSGQ